MDLNTARQADAHVDHPGTPERRAGGLLGAAHTCALAINEDHTRRSGGASHAALTVPFETRSLPGAARHNHLTEVDAPPENVQLYPGGTDHAAVQVDPAPAPGFQDDPAEAATACATVSSDSVRSYLNEINRIALLSPAEELSLARRVHEGQLAQRKIDATLALPEREQRDLRRVVSDGWLAREALIQANLRLVVHVARLYQKRGLDFMDLVQEGNMGLLRAVDGFEYQRGHRFSTYATWWIRQFITRAIADKARAVRLPVHLQATLSKVLRFKRELSQELTREPSSEELAQALGAPWTAARVEELLGVLPDPLSLDSPVGVDEEDTLGELLPDERISPPHAQSEALSLMLELERALSRLPDRDGLIVRLRMGLIDGVEHSREEIAQMLRLSRERVRQIEVRTLKQLRVQAGACAGLRSFLLD